MRIAYTRFKKMTTYLRSNFIIYMWFTKNHTNFNLLSLFNQLYILIIFHDKSCFLTIAYLFAKPPETTISSIFLELPWRHNFSVTRCFNSCKVQTRGIFIFWYKLAPFSLILTTNTISTTHHLYTLPFTARIVSTKPNCSIVETLRNNNLYSLNTCSSCKGFKSWNLAFRRGNRSSKAFSSGDKYFFLSVSDNCSNIFSFSVGTTWIFWNLVCATEFFTYLPNYQHQPPIFTPHIPLQEYVLMKRLKSL